MDEKDFAAFEKFALERGLDVEAEMTKVYAGDAEALARVFAFSTTFVLANTQMRPRRNT